LAANLKSTGTAEELKLKPVHFLSRKEVSIAIIGLAARKATTTPMPGRAQGLEIVKDEAALSMALHEVRAQGAQVIGVVSDGCLFEFPPLIDAHPEWKLDFVAGRDCEALYPALHNGTALVYPGRQWTSYARVVVNHVPTGNSTTSALIEVVNGAQDKGDETVNRVIHLFETKLETQLGQAIGFSKSGIPQESIEMSQWMGRALKETFKTDVAIFNRKGVRSALAPGIVKASHVWDVVPFENRVVVLKISGAQLKKAMENLEARAVGLRVLHGQMVDEKKRPLDDKKIYTLATTDYLYLGGSAFDLGGDPSPTLTKRAIQSVIIDWTRAQKSSPKVPLENTLRR
jgi:5'-nucleotidase / UDP-sugar diphosphatase